MKMKHRSRGAQRLGGDDGDDDGGGGGRGVVDGKQRTDGMLDGVERWMVDSGWQILVVVSSGQP
eukprot:CAMPEP_0195010272 /NCGR_PEP_ID=MMETSP0326_2-20130528/9982_1 /TAXON_ID=2866 ORGANISM="Crypthecodinium cohnii, Strain Seligo" /NCGR_SAMPLE_ID=MMETSP0326_2 /ASSEMBLY_ACC=CAM_ASM_000348 /LENGTH=63 /DNA_ID=CAMNT_0040018865 /DNA_START=426 /DNA_END=612 /DNA_ORIENTATION=-